MLNTIVPLSSSIISFIFAFFVFKRYITRKGTYLLFWGVGTVFYGIGGFCEFYYGAFGWNSLIYRLWYLFGAILVAAWLGQGTVYLLAKEKWAKLLTILLVLGSLYATDKIFSAQLDPSLMIGSGHTGAELSGHAIVTDGVRILTPFFNLYGTATLVGGAAYSAFIFWRKRVLLHRAIGNILIATGASRARSPASSPASRLRMVRARSKGIVPAAAKAGSIVGAPTTPTRTSLAGLRTETTSRTRWSSAPSA